VIAFLFSVVSLIVLLLVKLKQAWHDHLRPKGYTPEQKHRSETRRQFAGYLVEEMHKRNRSENWQDREYAELEAEVEAEGRRRRFFLPSRSSGVRREKSLAVALRRSSEKPMPPPGRTCHVLLRLTRSCRF
jgi:hypothetical protein